MKHDPRHIILIPLLAIIMAACSDTPLPAPAPAPGKQMRPLSFTMPSATLLPATASRADETVETEIRTAFEGEMSPPYWYNSIPADKFKNIVAGPMTLTYKTSSDKHLQVLFNDDSSDIFRGDTPDTEGEIIIDLDSEKATHISKAGIKIGTNNVTVTKITYTAVKSTGTDPENPDNPQPGATGALVYDGVSTQFTTGTLIGCVIAYKNAEAEGGYEYKANSCWTWHPEGLRLTKLFNADNAAIEINSDANDILRHYTTEELAAAAVDDPEIATDPRSPYFLRLLDPTAEYAFFFYYPYVDEEILTKEYSGAAISYPNSSESNNWGISGNSVLEKINNHSLISPVAKNESDGNGNTSIKTSKWTEYPVGAMVDLTIGENNDCLNHSDFMYASVKETSKGKPFTIDNAKNEISVVMQKKMVTMDLYVLTDVDETSLKLNPAETNLPMKRLKRFNLLAGNFGEDYNFIDQWKGTLIEKNSRYIPAFEGIKYPIIPCKIGTATETINGVATNYNVFRVIMPPQSESEFRCSLSFKVKESDKTLTLNEMHQNSGIKSLQSGYHYKLRFTKLNEQFGFHLDIVNWEKGDEISINRPD